MSAKNVDKHNRFRSITVGFRVSPEEQEELNRAVSLSGLPKQEYCYRKCMGREVVVQPNPRVHKALKTQMAAILAELDRIAAGDSVPDELLSTIDLIAITIMELQLAGSRCEQIMVLRLISHRFSKISKRIFTSRSSVMVCNRKSSRMSRAAPQILFRRFWYFE